MKRIAFVLAACVLTACGDAQLPLSPAGATSSTNPITNSLLKPGRTMIVTLRPGVDASSVARDHGVQVDYRYATVLNGFAGLISDAARAGLLRDSRVVRLDLDQDFSVEAGGAESNATWGLDRVDQRDNVLDHMYQYNTTGKGVTAYIIDTGVRYTHNDFGGRARFGYDAFGGDGSDCQGHGTHVAGTVGGRIYGVAKDVDLVSVRVLNCYGAGTTATILAGLDWIAGHATLPAVGNMSLGGGADSLVDAAVQKVIAAGVSMAVAAGNSAGDACNYSPARVPEAMTIGATNLLDESASWSNWGDCVDWFAPGVSITSDAYGSDDATATKSGTSMASPHTAGAAALILEADPTATPLQVSSTLASWTTKGIVTKAISVHNDLLYTLGTAGGGSPTNSPPHASFTVACWGLSCTFSDQSSDADGSIASWAWTFGDGATSTEQNPTYIYASSGTFTVTLGVLDNAGASGATSQSVSVTDTSVSNVPPDAKFTFTCSQLTCSFVDGSTDPDGAIVEWRWDFGDGVTSSVQSGADLTHTFTAGGNYPVQLSVTDDAGATTAITEQVPVGLILTAVGYRQKGKHTIDLSWSGTTATEVDLFLNGSILGTFTNDGTYTYSTDIRGHGSYTFRVCEAGTSVCSREENVSY